MSSEPAREPLVLLHGLGMSARVWDRVVPFLEPYHEVVVHTALGHRGGTPSTRRPARVRDLVDHAEQMLDDRGIGQCHLAGSCRWR